MKKGLIKSVAVLFAAFSLGGVVVPPMTAQAEILERMPADRGEWRKDEHGWYYMLNVNSGMGYVKSSWTKDNGKWYYFDKWGYMYRDAWIPYKGDYYYVGADGAMWYNATTPDGYRVDGNGKWIR
ncbi:choline-binding protein A [Lachnoanaerobaculum sp. Marseille-Q4761]|uniref:choline-binding protein A n=1 Tax=Lachnoanaerobaculum sp. Marseille-Q4761 TaxID=2819511 RepID=UPI001AA1BE9B|nr:choline-binding protein A [Lachnoanaerobaculum sp. Marseille-Q4761]MBO1870270.1 choline-binding protein A [Lachnoanaerobaculum sp. Marseille-Q4761]